MQTAVDCKALKKGTSVKCCSFFLSTLFLIFNIFIGLPRYKRQHGAKPFPPFNFPFMMALLISAFVQFPLPASLGVRFAGNDVPHGPTTAVLFMLNNARFFAVPVYLTPAVGKEATVSRKPVTEFKNG